MTGKNLLIGLLRSCTVAALAALNLALKPLWPCCFGDLLAYSGGAVPEKMQRGFVHPACWSSELFAACYCPSLAEQTDPIEYYCS